MRISLGIFTLQTSVVDSDIGIPAAFLRLGLVPCSPYRPTLVITVRVLEFFRNVHLRCPHMTVHSFVKGLCDIFGIPFRPYLNEQFSICYDLYVQIREEVKQRVADALDRHGNQWRLRNACAACTYKLEGEDALIFDMLVTMDGNDSLKRLLRKEQTLLDESGRVAPESNQPRTDSREVYGDYYLSREKVDRWARARVDDVLQQLQLPLGDVKDKNPCATRWSNMINELTARMWGIFDETGIFLALCRHGFVLVVADMVRSGELYVNFNCQISHTNFLLDPSILWPSSKHSLARLVLVLVAATISDANSPQHLTPVSSGRLLDKTATPHLLDHSTAMLTTASARPLPWPHM